MGFSTDNKNAVLDKLFGITDFTPSATHYIGLSTTQPGDDGSNVNEPSGGSYTRIAVTNDGTSWVAAAGGEKTNGIDVVWATVTASWGTVGWWVIYDAAVAGNFQHWGALQTPRAIDIGDVFRFLAGDLVVRLRSE